MRELSTVLASGALLGDGFMDGASTADGSVDSRWRSALRVCAGTFVSALVAGSLGVGRGSVIKVDDELFEGSGRGDVCERRASRGRCGLDVAFDGIEVASETCAVVCALCSCGFETCVIEKFAARMRLVLSSTVLAFLRATLKFFCFFTLVIASFSRL